MPITQRGKSWQATLRHNGQRWRKDFSTKAEAEEWYAETQKAVLRGQAFTKTSEGMDQGDGLLTLQALLDLTAANVWKTAKAQQVLRANGQDVVDVLGRDLRPDQITTTRIKALVDVLRKRGNSDGTINGKLSALSRMLHFANENGYIRRVPKIERLSNYQKIRFITTEEEANLLAFFKSIAAYDMHDFCVVALGTGMTVDELLGLRWSEIDSTRIQLDASRMKRRTTRTIPMTHAVAEVMARRRGAPGPLVFRAMTQSTVTHHWNRARQQMGLSDDSEFVPYVMRHTFCCRLAQRGASAATIAELAGHSNIQVTMRYVNDAYIDSGRAISLLD